MSDCTKDKSQRRTITVNARPYHEALKEARARQQTPEFKKQYQARAGIEGTISQAVRVTKLRKARYRGLIKTRLQHYATATAINILRLGNMVARTRAGANATIAFSRTGAPNSLNLIAPN